MANATSYRNGADVEFDYLHAPNASSIVHDDLAPPSLTSKKKRKKKKKKAKSANGETAQDQDLHPHDDPAFSVNDAHINDPDADYPTSRVIKVGPSGDLIVESLDDEYPQESKQQLPQISDIQSREQLDFSIFHFHNDDERAFWLNLSDADKKDILRVDKEHLMENLRILKRNHPNKGMPFNQFGVGDHHNQGGDQCACAYCGRNSRFIEDELAIAYNQHLDVIADYLENCVNARAEFPRLIPEPRFHSDAPSPPLHPPRSPHPESVNHSHTSPNLHANSTLPNQLVKSDEETSIKEEEPQLGELETAATNDSDEKILMNLEPQEMLDILGKARKVLELINPNTIQEVVKYELLLRNIKPEAAIDESAKNLTEIFANIKKDDENGLAKAVEFIKCCSRLYKESNDQFNDVLQFLSNFADLIMKNEGKSFVDMLESLTESRNARMNIAEEQKIEQITDVNEEDQQVLRSPLNVTQSPDGAGSTLLQADESHGIANGETSRQDAEYFEEYGEDYHQAHDHDHDHDYACDHDCSHGHECDHDCDHEEYDNDELDDDEDSQQGYDDGELDDEEAQRGRSEEIRGFVMIQAVNMIRERFMEAYERKLSEDRTQMFIAELEAEENAKKERELKKLKAKEKQKEKKRLQQLEKEEEKKRKEAEELARKAEEEKKQEAIRAEQMKKKEEARLKKEEEKRRRIEALQKKEVEAAERKRKQDELKLQNEKKQKEKELRQRQLEEKKLEEKKLQEKKLEEKRLEEAKLREKRKEEEKKVDSKKSGKKNVDTASRGTSSAPRAPDDPISNQAPAIPAQTESPMGHDNFNETEDYLHKQQQELLEKANSLSLDLANPLMPLDELNIHAQATSPMKNHLLDQLYRAKPQSISSTSNSTPQINPAELNQFGLQEGVPPYISPSKNTDLFDNLRGVDWRNGASAFPHQGQSRVGGAHVASNFSPFDSNATLDQLQQPPSVDMLLSSALGSNVRPSIQQSNSYMWSNGSASRSNSIWNSSSEPQHGNPNIWGTSKSPQAYGNGMMPMGGSRISLSDQGANSEVDTIQKAAADAFNLMLSNNQLMLGLASAINMCQIVKGLLGNASMGMAEFLNSLKSPGKHQFDFIYDDYGSVTHLKLIQHIPNGAIPQATHGPGHLGHQGLGQPVNPNLQFGYGHTTQQQNAFQNQPFHQPMPNVPQHPQPLKAMNVGPPGIQQDENSQKPNGLQLPGTIQNLLNPSGFGQGNIW